MNQPADDDVLDVNINLNFNIVTSMKKATKKIPRKATTVLNVLTTKEKTRVAFGPTMNQPTPVDSTDVDIVDASQDVEVNTSQDVDVNVNIVTPTKKATKKIPTLQGLMHQRQRRRQGWTLGLQ
jgi:hypothetical protein